MGGVLLVPFIPHTSNDRGMAFQPLHSFGLCLVWLKPNSPISAQGAKNKICNLTLNRLLIVEFVKKMVYLGVHHSEHQGLMG